MSLPGGDFSVNVYRLRLETSLTPDHRVSTLVQYNDSGELAGINLRYNWIYRPGADLFVVNNETWDAPTLCRLMARDRQLIVKLTKLFQR